MRDLIAAVVAILFVVGVVMTAIPMWIEHLASVNQERTIQCVKDLGVQNFSMDDAIKLCR